MKGPLLRAGVGIVAVVAATIGLQVPVMAAQTWTAVPSPSIAGRAEQQLRSVSCPTQNFCVAVGAFDYGLDVPHPPRSSGRTLIEMWNGHSWSIVSSPATGSNGALNGVSCLSTSFCMAVGGSGGQPMVETWDGAAWAVQSNPPEYGNNTFQSVACTSPTSCVAVGFNQGYVKYTYAKVWNGTHWYEPGNPYVSSFDNELDGVSCVSATSCTAVGSYSDGTTKHALIEAWNGSGPWTTVPTKDISTGDSALHGVSCVSIKWCTAVGETVLVKTSAYTSPSTSLVETWNGLTWATTPSVPGINNGDVLESVSCLSPRSCTAVGYSATGGTLAERWNGVVWLPESSPTPSASANYTDGTHLSGVSCASPNSCSAVGDYYNPDSYAGLIETRKGSGWSITPSPQQPQSFDELNAVSCPSSDNCVAVGRVQDSGAGVSHSLIETWNGSAWTAMTGPGFEMDGVSCVSTSFCMAVGDWVIESWNGSTWTQLPNPAGPHTALAGVSCVAINMCMAVGPGPLTETWNGSAWSVVPSVNPGGTSWLRSVSCASAQSCMAVGFSTPGNNVFQPLVESWNGTSWTLTPSPNAGGLESVSCSAPSACTAVGYDQSSQFQTLIASWDGATWTVASTSVPGNLLGVSCVSVDSCTAVGWTGASTLILSGGSSGWSVDSSANPGNVQNGLDGVSCDGPGSCTAVGVQQTNADDLTLVERST